MIEVELLAKGNAKQQACGSRIMRKSWWVIWTMSWLRSFDSEKYTRICMCHKSYKTLLSFISVNGSLCTFLMRSLSHAYGHILDLGHCQYSDITLKISYPVPLAHTDPTPPYSLYILGGFVLTHTRIWWASGLHGNRPLPASRRRGNLLHIHK